MLKFRYVWFKTFIVNMLKKKREKCLHGNPDLLRKKVEDLVGFLWAFGPVYFIKMIIFNIHTKI